MSNSDHPFSFALIKKIATVPARELTGEDAHGMLHGLVEFLRKEAKLSEAETSGFVFFLAEQGGMPKVAGPLDTIWNNTVKPVAQGIGKEIQAGMAPGQNEVIKNAPKTFIDGAIGTAKEYGGKAMDWIKNPENMKTVAPYAIGAAGTFLGAKALGAGTGTAALAGLAGGAAGGYAWNNRDQLLKPPAPVAGAEPAAAPVKPVQEVVKAPGLQADLSNQISANATDTMKGVNGPGPANK